MSRPALSLSILTLMLGLGCGLGLVCDQTIVVPNAIPTADDARSVLERWRSQLLPTLPAAERQRIEQEVAAYPATAPAGTAPLQMVGTDVAGGKEVQAAVGQRDWAYAGLGIEYALRGGFEASSAGLVDVSLWCFIEAALLNLTESEHLSNVAFHLNDRGQYADARTLLEYARTLAPTNIAVRNNLAFARAAQGDPAAAVEHQVAAVARAPGARFLWERLARYQELAGWAGQAALSRAIAQRLATLPALPEPTVPTSLAGLNVLIELNNLMPGYMADFAALGGAPAVPMTLEYDPAHWVPIGEIRLERDECIQRVRRDHAFEHAAVQDVLACEQCLRPAALKELNLARQFANRTIAQTRTWENQSLVIVNDYLDRGLDIVGGHTELSAADRAALTSYWHEMMSQQVAAIEAAAIDVPRQAHDLVRHYDMQLSNLDCGRGSVPSWIWNPSELLPFGGKITLWFGVGQLSLDIPKGQVELQFGQGVQGKVGWNWKTSTPSLGIGYGVNLDKVVETGAFLTFNPDSGLTGTLEFSPAGYPLLMGGADPPQIELFRRGALMN